MQRNDLIDLGDIMNSTFWAYQKTSDCEGKSGKGAPDA